MSLREDIEALNERLRLLAHDADTAVLDRYALAGGAESRWLRARARHGLGRLLRRLGLRRTAAASQAWEPGLQHAETAVGARALLVWALGEDSALLRSSCSGIARLQASLPGFAPVLVTDVADFAFYSRLGWLVEYVPNVGGESSRYREIKLGHLARLYSSSPAVPIAVGLAPDAEVPDILESIAEQARRKRPSGSDPRKWL